MKKISSKFTSIWYPFRKLVEKYSSLYKTGVFFCAIFWPGTHRNMKKAKGGTLLQSWIFGVMEQFGYLGMAILIAVENLFPPIPSELILTFGGFLTTQTALRLPGMILYATLGSLAGAAALYGVGRLLTKERLGRLLDGTLCRKLGFQKEEVLNSVERFASSGKKTVLLGRFVPILRSLVSIPAGMARMDLCSFIWLTAIGSSIWNGILITLGAAAGASWALLSEKCGEWMGLIKAAVVLVAVLASVLRILQMKKKAKKTGPTLKK